MEAGHIDVDPTLGIKQPKQKADGGFHTWTPEEMAAFEAHWPIGTRERLAYDIMLWTGLRRGDAARLGPRHLVDGLLTITTEKTDHVVVMPVLKPLADSIAATPIGPKTFIITTDGKPMVKDGFGHWFGKVCRAVVDEDGKPLVKGNCHGLRKALAVKLAESGASPLEIGAILGNDMGEFYAKKANRAKLAIAALSRLSAPAPSEKSGITD